MTILDQLIDGLTEDSLSTSNALRKFLVVGSRLQSGPIKEWVRSELNGYGDTSIDQYPSYRGPLHTPVSVLFAGPFQSSQTYYLDEHEVPDEREFRQAFFYIYLNQSLASLEEMTRSEEPMGRPWPTNAVMQLRRWSNELKAPRLEMYEVHSAKQLVSKPLLHGVIDAVRNKALQLALDLQADFPDAGETNGPTVQDKEVGNIVKYHFETHIHGGTNTVGQGENVTQTVTVGQGEHVTQTVTVNQGDSAALMLALEKLGLGLEDRNALGEALEQDGNKPGNAVKEILGKIATGAIKIAGEVATGPVLAGVKLAITGFTGIPIP